MDRSGWQSDFYMHLISIIRTLALTMPHLTSLPRRTRARPCHGPTSIGGASNSTGDAAHLPN